MFESLRILFFLSNKFCHWNEDKKRKKNAGDNQLHTRFTIQKVTVQLYNSFSAHFLRNDVFHIFAAHEKKKQHPVLHSIYCCILFLTRVRNGFHMYNIYSGIYRICQKENFVFLFVFFYLNLWVSFFFSLSFTHFPVHRSMFSWLKSESMGIICTF